MRLPNGFGSVHKLPGNRRKPYRVRVTVGFKNTKDNSKIQEYKTLGYYATREEGIIALVRFNQRPYNLEYKDMTFEDVYEAWSIEHFEKIVSSSKRIWVAAYNHSTALYGLKFKDIRVVDLERTINNANVGTATKIRMKSLYNMLYRYAIKNEIVDKNYATYCETLQNVKKIVREPFSDDEIKLLWDNLDIPFVDMILINIYSGLRPRELVEIKCENIDFNENIMRGGIKTVAGKNRIIPIHNAILKLVKKRYNKHNEYLFYKENGNNMNYDDYRNRFRKIMNELGLKHKPHDTRHTFITRAKRYNVNEYILKLVVGHSISDITENVYTHRTTQEMLDEINKIEK